jgi:hypothetical protein
MSFASTTSVSVEKSRNEIQRTLEKYGSNAFMFGQEDNLATVGFKMKGRSIKFQIQIPKILKEKDRQIERTRWRCLLLAIKAKLECQASGISTFEQEFLAHIVLPNGKTVGENILPQIEESYKTGGMPLLLGAPSR